mmetsp:Transcript_19158/g.37877  ORF Transcript_19158/g.37877 Transcript_19158/m.37877 type:complete len:215 (+) Transcript_19158:3772-4416(+)
MLSRYLMLVHLSRRNWMLDSLALNHSRFGSAVSPCECANNTASCIRCITGSPSTYSYSFITSRQPMLFSKVRMPFARAWRSSMFSTLRTGSCGATTRKMRTYSSESRKSVDKSFKGRTLTFPLARDTPGERRRALLAHSTSRSSTSMANKSSYASVSWPTSSRKASSISSITSARESHCAFLPSVDRDLTRSLRVSAYGKELASLNRTPNVKRG